MDENYADRLFGLAESLYGTNPEGGLEFGNITAKKMEKITGTTK